MAPKPRKRVEAETKDETSNTTTTLLRAKDGSAFVRCDGCSKNIAVALVRMHNCSLDAKIRENLEAQVVETQIEAKKKTVERKKSTSDEPKAKRVRKSKDEKKGSNSNKTKRPLTAFFVFMADFRKTFKEENPGSNVKDVAKQGGEKWKSLTEEEKKVYLDKAAELKEEYNKSLENNANEEEEEDDEEKQADVVDDAEEKETDDAAADEVEENEVENKEPEGKEEEEDEILDDY